jgi:hexosaminidase
MKKLIAFILCVCVSQFALAQNNIIPAPVSYEYTEGMFMLDNQVSIDVRTTDQMVLNHAKVFQSFLAASGSNVELKAVTAPDRANKVIILSLNKTTVSELGQEGYNLEVKETSIELSANAAPGIFNGLQTLRQLLPREFENRDDYSIGMGMIMGCKIKDYPRFGWRGVMLDVSRHFFSVDEVKAYLDKMAQYKLNVFHWHLTDDEGWRIEIKSLPKLTEVGSWRVERHGRFGDTRPFPKEGEKATYGGFYTQEQIKDVIKYAAERNVRIVPEIDIPGHSMAALAAYPELSVNKEPKFVNPGSKFAEWPASGGFYMLIENTLDPSNEKVYEFVDKVMTEVAALFPGEYIHMGGDECDHSYWEKSAEVQKFMKKMKIKDTHDLQAYFVGRVGKIIQSKGKKMIGWDEIIEGGDLSKETAVMNWREAEIGIDAAKKGYKVVMTPKKYTYLDYTQGDHSVENPIYSDLLLERVYSYEPVTDGVDEKSVLGGQGNLWTEVIPNLPFAMYMTYPRAFAISETFWSQKEMKNWDSFMSRTEQHFGRFDAGKINISRAIYEPIISLKKIDGKLMCELANHVPNTDIFYTIDNTYPVNFGHKYDGAVEIPEGNLSLRTQSFRNGNPVGRELIISREDLLKRAR